MQSYLCPAESEAAWQRISPLLDEALDRLSEKDRDAIALRFLEHKSLRQVAEKLGISEDGAQKRVARAIEKLRVFFVRHGKSVSPVALTGALASNSVQAAPAALAASIFAVVTSQSAVVGSAVAALAKATAEALTRAKLQVFAVRAASVAVLLGLAIVTFVRTNQPTGDSNMSAGTTLPETPRLPAVESSQPIAAGARAPAADLRELLLRVVDAQSGAPVTNARLTLVSDTSARTRVTNIFVTDAQGSGLISYAREPVKSWSHRIEIFRDGYVPRVRKLVRIPARPHRRDPGPIYGEDRPCDHDWRSGRRRAGRAHSGHENCLQRLRAHSLESARAPHDDGRLSHRGNRRPRTLELSATCHLDSG